MLEDQKSYIIFGKFLQKLVFSLFLIKWILQLDKIVTIWQNSVIFNVCSIFSIDWYNLIAVWNKNILRTFEPQNSIWIRTLSLRSNLDVLIKKKGCSRNKEVSSWVGRTLVLSLILRNFCIETLHFLKSSRPHKLI